MATNSNIDVQQRFVTAALTGDGATLQALSDPGLVLEQGTSMPYVGTYQGAEGFLRFLGAFAETLEIEKLEPVRIYQADDPDWLVCEFDVRATVKASGKPYVTTLLESWHFRDGKVAAIKPHYFNSPLIG
jgi:ketosteroid isomerase-like protein